MKVLADRKQILVPYRPDVANIATGVKTTPDNKWMVLDHDPGNVKLLKNMGVKAPSPILHQYDWAGDTPFESQKVTAAMLVTEPRAYVLSGMGVGKTRAALYGFDFLRREFIVDKLIVVAPLSTLKVVWENEIFCAFEGMRAAVVYGDRKRRHKILKQDADVYIINHDGVKVVHEALLDVMSKYRCALVLDELSVYKNKQTARWKLARPLVNKSLYAWGMTGTPVPQGPVDAYGQVMLLTPERAPRSFKRFRDSVMIQINQFKWVPKKTANDTVFELMQPAVRFSLEDCHDLPPISYLQRECPINAKQRAAEKELKTHYTLTANTGEKVSVVNEAARMNKMLQLYAGFFYDAEGRGRYLDATPRMKLTLDVINEAEGKVIVFCPYRWGVLALHKVVSKFHSCEFIHGGVSAAERNKHFIAFQQSDNPKVLVAHPSTMSHGVTLTAANTIVWFSPTHSVETWLQANARIHRAGQKLHCNIVIIEGGRLEKRVYSRLIKRQSTQGLLLEMFEEQEAG